MTIRRAGGSDLRLPHPVFTDAVKDLGGAVEILAPLAHRRYFLTLASLAVCLLAENIKLTKTSKAQSDVSDNSLDPSHTRTYKHTHIQTM